MVRDGLAAGAPWAKDAFALYVDRVAEGLSDLVLLLAPSIVVLGGGVSEIGELLAHDVRRCLADRMPSFIHTPDVVTATLGNLAGAIGAALAAV